jgi:hypothetical protein
MNIFQKIGASLMLAALAACGGGSDDDNTPGAIDKYVGEWTSNCVREEDGSSFIADVDITKIDSNKAQAKGKEYKYSSSDCTGTPDKYEWLDTITSKGQKIIDGIIVDKVEAVDKNGDSFKLIFTIQDGKIVIGDEDGPKDADGYPTTFHNTDTYTKRTGGGSDDDNTPGAIDKYVGEWTSNCVREEDGSSFIADVDITKININKAQVEAKRYKYSSPNCTGAFDEDGGPGTITSHGQKIIDGITVDKIEDVNANGDSSKLIFFIQSGNVVIGKVDGLDGPQDADGYPANFNNTDTYTKRP